CRCGTAAVVQQTHLPQAAYAEGARIVTLTGTCGAFGLGSSARTQYAGIGRGTADEGHLWINDPPRAPNGRGRTSAPRRGACLPAATDNRHRRRTGSRANRGVVNVVTYHGDRKSVV